MNRFALFFGLLLAWLPSLATAGEPTLYYGPTFVTGHRTATEAAAILVDESGTIQKLYRGVPRGLTGVRYQKLAGAVAYPGFHDAHLHLAGIGMQRSGVNLAGVHSREELRNRVAAYVASHPQATVVRGFGWDQNLFPDRQFPSLQDIAGLTDKPIFLMRVDGHAALTNEPVLHLGGFTSGVPNSRTGGVFRNAQGNPTGLLLDEAVLAMQSMLPEPSLDERKEWMRVALQAAHDNGLTAVHDMGMFAGDIEALLALQEEEPLPVRVYAYIAGNHLGWLLGRCLTPSPACTQIGNVKLMGIKLMLDGAMGSRGALLAADYNDDPGNHGHPAYSLALQRAVFRVARKLGWQIAIHAIGDEANRIAVAWVESDAREQTNRLPVRVEHAQLLHGEDFVRFAKSGAIASMQPIHVADDHSWAVARVGNERAKNAYAWGKHARAGAKLSFGSDAPVSDMNPAYGVYVALTRKDLTGNPPGGWYPENSLLLPETVEAYTAGAARAVGEEKSGSLLPGKQFSVTVFEKDCRNQTAECWLSVRAHALP